MKREMVFVRAQSPSGKWGAHDVLDLTDESFRLFVIDTLIGLGVLAAIDPEDVEGDNLPYQSTKEEH